MPAKRTPKIEAFVVNAIRRLQDVQGSTSREISNYISQEYDIPGKEIRRQVQLALKRGLSYGILQRSKGGYYACNRDYLDHLPWAVEMGDGVMEPCPRRRRRRSRSRRRARRRRRSRVCPARRRRRRSRVCPAARRRRRRSRVCPAARRRRRRRRRSRRRRRRAPCRICADSAGEMQTEVATVVESKRNDDSKDEDDPRGSGTSMASDKPNTRDSSQNSQRSTLTPDDRDE